MRPGDRLDQFEVLDTLGHGAFATTYVARDVATGERVVLKCPAPTALADPETAARFQREAAITRRLRHPNIQGAARSPVPRDGAYLAMEYVAGDSLRQRLQSEPPPSIVEAAETVIEIARALDYAHERGVFHRDLKPENVIILPDGHVKVIDFGNARLAGARRLTWRVKGETAGTPDYMAPEQVEGGRGDARTDTYALGVILYELLAGRVPFSGDNANAVMYQQVHALPPPLDEIRPGLPEALKAIVLRALAKRPDERYQSAANVAQELQAFLGGAPAAPPDTPARGDGLPWRERLGRRFKQRS